MRRLLPLLILALCVISCKEERRLSESEYSLLKDFGYAQQANYAHHKDAAFVRQYERVELKKHDSLLQIQPGSVSFATRLYEHPVLKYEVRFQQRSKSNLELILTVESDYPLAESQHFRPALNQVNTVDLSRFKDRIVRISFSARSRNLPGLGGMVTWIDPTIVQVVPEAEVKSERVQAFRERQAASNVMIFLFDATNASHVHAYGYEKPTTPVIDSVASEGVLWKNAFSQAVSTMASTGTLFTGMLPDVHRVLKKPSMLQERFKTMAECFREMGFETALFTANPNASAVTGYGQGFRYNWNLRKGSPVSASEVVPFVNQWVDRVKNQQFFSYVHFREPHEPYSPPAAVLSRFTSEPNFHLPYFEAFVPPDEEGIRKVITAYDANLASGDEQFGKIIDHLKKIGLFDRTIIVIIADHGEAFWAHGKQGHNSQVYEDMVHIPMIMHFPASPELHGKRMEQLVGTVDLFPTFADLFHFSHKGIHLSGRSMLPFLVGGTFDPNRLIVSETSAQEAYGLRSREFKYIHYRSDAGKAEFYNLLQDPGEKTNVMASYPATSAFYRMSLLKLLDENKQLVSKWNAGPQQTATIDSETEEELRALGYVN